MKVEYTFISSIKAKEAMRNLFLIAAKRFGQKADVNFSEGYSDIWFAMPDQKGQFASIGFEESTHRVYWTVSRGSFPSRVPRDKITKAGYSDEYLKKGYYYKYIDILESFFEMSETDQVSYISQKIDELLREHEQIVNIEQA